MSSRAVLFGFDPPVLDLGAALTIAAEHWGLAGAPHRLRGERSHNTLITGRDDAAWILQVQSASEDPAVIDLQTRALVHLERHAPDVPVSRVVPTAAGELHAHVPIGDRIHLARLVTYLPGTTFDPIAPLPAHAYRRIGRLVGRIAVGLDGFEHPAAAHFMPWDVANGLIVDADVRADLTAASTAAIESVDDRLHRVAATVHRLPHRTIHNDGHAGNLLRHDAASHQVTGIIDVGDLVHTVTAADVAIIAESFAPDHSDPAAVVAEVTAGYHAELRLGDDEIAAIPELVLARAALNVILGEHQMRHAPHLARGAAANLPDVVARLVRWSRLDSGAIVARIHDALDTVPHLASDTPEAAP